MSQGVEPRRVSHGRCKTRDAAGSLARTRKPKLKTIHHTPDIMKGQAMVGIPSDTTDRTGSSCEEKKIFQNIRAETFLHVLTGAGVSLVSSATDLVNVRVLVVRQERSHEESGRQEAGSDEGVESHREWPRFLRPQQGDDQTGVCRAERAQGEDLEEPGSDQDGEARGEGEDDHYCPGGTYCH